MCFYHGGHSYWQIWRFTQLPSISIICNPVTSFFLRQSDFNCSINIPNSFDLWIFIVSNKVSLSRLVILVINRPSVARAFLQLPPSLIHSSIKSSFVEISSEHLHSQAVRAGELNFRENVHPPSCVTACKVSWKKKLILKPK